MKQEFIYIDLNALDGSRMIVLNPLIFKEVVNKYGKAESGMDIFLWTDDLDENNKYDPMVYSGKLIFDSVKNNWFIEINKDEIKHLSESSKFKGFSVKDIVGDEEYVKIKRNHPNWL
jgi:hypothetical protein